MKLTTSAMLTLAAAALLCGTAAAAVAEGDSVARGQAIPVVSLKGASIDLRSELLPAAGSQPNGASATLLIFWATWCQPCLHEVPEITEIGRFYAKQGLRVVSVAMLSPGDDTEKVADTARDNRIDYEVLFDQRDGARQAFEVKSLPTSLLIDGKGIVRWRGNVFPSDINERIKAILGPGDQSGAK